MHDAEDSVARDHADDLRSAIVRTGDDGHLVDVRSEETFEEPEKRLVGRGPEDPFARNHDGLHGVMSPLVTGHGVQLLDIHHADEPVVGNDEMAASAGAQDLGAVILESAGTIDRRNFMAHDVGSAESGERFANSRLRDAFLCRVQEKEADEDAPEAADDGAFVNEEAAQKDQSVGDETSRAASDARGTGEIFRGAPKNGAKNSAAVERKAGEQIEDGQQAIGDPQRASEGLHDIACRKEQAQAVEETSEHATRKRAGDGNVEFLNGAGGVALNAGYAAKDEERDGDDADAIVLSDNTMSELVKKERREEQEAGENPHGPCFGLGPAPMFLDELHGERVSDRRENNDPGGMQIDWDTEDPADAHSAK